MRSVEILGINITAEPLSKVLTDIKTVLANKERKGRYVCATSVHGVIESKSDPGLKNILNSAFINHPDGQPLVRAGRRLGASDIDQIRGSDIYPAVCNMTAKMNVRHFFYGASEGVAERLAESTAKKYPGLKVAGTYCPPFRALTETEKKEIIKTIKASKADIVWVGLSTPKQEKWIGEFHGHLNVKLLFSVGAVFDLFTGGISSVPPWMHKLGLEWFFRLITEPRRLWRRYFKVVPMFLILVFLQIVKSGSKSS